MGNEVNGEWLGASSEVAEKIHGAYLAVKARGGKTALTLYYNGTYDGGVPTANNCWEDPQHQMFVWAGANVPADMRDGLDYVLVSYYEDDCEGIQPDWQSVFDEWMGWRSLRNTQLSAGASSASSSPGGFRGQRRGAGVSRPIWLSGAEAIRDEDASAGAISGHVLSEANSKPVPGARMTFAGPSGLFTVTSKSDGNFEFQAPKAGTYSLAVAIADGYLPFAPEWGDSPVRFVARVGEHLSNVSIYLTPAVDYVGNVVDPKGVPVAGAKVHVVGADASGNTLAPTPEEWVSGADGANHKEAVKWLTLAAQSGDAQSQCDLAVMYHEGQGVRQDHVQAARLYRQAAEQGDERASYGLYLCYRDGEGVRRNRRRARFWLEKAAVAGVKQARTALASAK